MGTQASAGIVSFLRRRLCPHTLLRATDEHFDEAPTLEGRGGRSSVLDILDRDAAIGSFGEKQADEPLGEFLRARRCGGCLDIFHAVFSHADGGADAVKQIWDVVVTSHWLHGDARSREEAAHFFAELQRDFAAEQHDHLGRAAQLRELEV